MLRSQNPLVDGQRPFVEGFGLGVVPLLPLNFGQVEEAGGPDQALLLVLVPGVVSAACGSQQLGDHRVPGFLGQRPGRLPIGVGSSHLRPGVDQRQDRLPVSVGRRQHQRGPALLVARVQVGARPDQHLDDGRLSPPGHIQEIPVETGLGEYPSGGQK